MKIHPLPHSIYPVINLQFSAKVSIYSTISRVTAATHLALVRGHPRIPLLCNTAISIALFISSGRSVHHIPHPLRSLSPLPLLNLSSREQRLHWMWHRAIWFGFGRAVALAVANNEAVQSFSAIRVYRQYIVNAAAATAASSIVLWHHHLSRI